MRRAQRLSPIVLSATADHGNSALSPTAGYRAQASLEHASALTVSDYRYNRATVDGAVYRGLGRAVLAVHARAGWVTALSSTAEATGAEGGEASGPIVHPRKRFFAGGARSVRGFGENQLGPRVLTIAAPSDTTALYASCLGARDITACSALLAERGMSDFTPRPVGGNSVLEGSVEFRFPIWGPFVGAAFVDGALVGNGDITAFAEAAGAVTPGVGVRYETPVGPVRVDVGYRPDLTQRLAVYTETSDAAGQSELVRIGERDYNANDRGRFIDRLVLHFSIGQAF
jgi:outer membrane protein assembly factor BamA